MASMSTLITHKPVPLVRAKRELLAEFGNFLGIIPNKTLLRRVLLPK
jgi:hypothetical protein